MTDLKQQTPVSGRTDRRGGMAGSLSGAALLGATTIAAFAWVSADAHAARHGPGCTDTGYDHNGSIVSVVECHGSLDIRYGTPREGLAGIGVREGTLLAEAEIVYDGTAQLVRGTAYTFKRGCGPMAFRVEGWLVMPAGPTGFRDIVLEGQAPKRGSDCRVREWRAETLKFQPIGAFLGGPEDADRRSGRRIDGEFRFETHADAAGDRPGDVPEGVDLDDYFRPAVGHWADVYQVEGPPGMAAPVRERPDHDAPTIGHLRTGTTGIDVYGCTNVPGASQWETMTPTQRNEALARGWCAVKVADGRQGHVWGGNLTVMER